MSEHLVIGIGHPHRGDDAAGLTVIRRMRHRAAPSTHFLETTGDATALMEAWRGYESVTIVDAVVGGGDVGAIVRVVPDEAPHGTGVLRASTHSFGVAEAIGLARQLHELPSHLVVYGIEGRRFGVGAEMSPEVVTAVETLTRRLEGGTRATHGS